MKKTIAELLFLIIAISATAQELTFRGYKFGTPIDTIIENEGAPSTRFDSTQGNLIGDEVLQYDNIIVANHKSRMQLEFADKKLMAGTYQFNLKNVALAHGVSDPREVSQIYNDLYNKLSELYAKPIRTNVIELIEGNISSLYANQIAQGAPYITQWEYKEGAVVLQAIYNNNWDLLLIYISPEYYKKLKVKKTSNEGL